MSKYTTLFASSPTQADAGRFLAEAEALIKSKLEVEFNLDPRRSLDVGTLVASCRGLTLTFQKRAAHRLPDGTGIELFAVFGKSGDKDTPVYLGNEVRLSDGRVVAQRLRSPESATAFKNASTSAARHDKAANLFLANWRDEAVLDSQTAKRLVVMSFPSDMTAGVAYRLSWYCREHMVGCGRVDLKPALPALCTALDEADAKAKADAEAAAAVKAIALQEIQGDAKVTELRATARQLGIAGVSRLKKEELKAAIQAAVSPERHEVTPEQAKAINIALNLIDMEGGQGRLRTALKAAGINVPLQEGAPAGTWMAKAVEAAKACVIAETVEA